MFSSLLNNKAAPSLFRRLRDRATQGGRVRLVHLENPLSWVLESVLYLSVGYLLAGKAIRALLRRLSVTRHARDSCAEATLLGLSSAVCLFLSKILVYTHLFLCWTELRPRRDVHRKENTLAGVLAHNRLFDEHGADPTNGRAAFVLVSALLLHAAGVTWYNHGLDLQVVKRTAFFAFYVTARNQRFKCLGAAATLVVTLAELLLQLTRVVCCFERKRWNAPLLTYLSFSTYVTVWTAVFVGVLPWFFVWPSLHRDTPLARMPPMCLLCGSLFLFYVIEVVTMPLLKVIKQWILPGPRLVSCGRLEGVLIPPPARVLDELRKLHAMKQRARAARAELDRRHGSCKKTRDVYKSLKMIMAVKRRIRNFRQAKLPPGSEEPSTFALESEPPDSDLHHSSSAPVDTASEIPDGLHFSSAPINTASEIPDDLHLSSAPVDTATEIPDDLHLSSAPINTASETFGDLHLSSRLINTASGTYGHIHLYFPLVHTASEIPDDDIH